MEVVLLSGGIESVTLLYDRAQNAPVTAVFIDYGQRAAHQEQKAATTNAQAVGCRLLALNIRSVGAALAPQGVLTAHVPLPARNLVAISLAANVALQLKASSVCIGLQRDDQAHREGGPAFIQALTCALKVFDLALETPYAHLSKACVVAHGRALGVDYDKTYSCLLGHVRACGRCAQCRARQDALQDARR